MMALRLILVFVTTCSVLAIKVPVAQIEDSAEEGSTTHDENSKQPIYYESDNSEIDSYLIPPNPHQPEESISGSEAPATYLLPPLPNSKSEYFTQTEPSVDTDWYPIAQTLPPAKVIPLRNQQKEPQYPLIISGMNNQDLTLLLSKKGKKLIEPVYYDIPIPSRQLQPPGADQQSHFFITPTTELELPAVEIAKPFTIPIPSSDLELPLLEPKQKFDPLVNNIPLHFKTVDPTLALHLIPPKPLAPNRLPTKLYPKKYSNGFKPIPIPLSQYVANNDEVLIAKPIKYKPLVSSGEAPVDEKKIYLYEQAEQKRKLKEQDEGNKHSEEDYRSEEVPYSEELPEPDVSETNFRRPLPQRQVAEAEPEQEEPTAPPAPKDRTEFHVHGMKGPHSYQFGYDTGKGKNRQFRYEERDNDGHVRGHYGYVDRSGKMRVVNYDADPEHGFHADAPK